jgi:hypothetical protein
MFSQRKGSWFCVPVVSLKVLVPRDWGNHGTKLSSHPRPARARHQIRCGPSCSVPVSVTSKCTLQGTPYAKSILRFGFGQRLDPASPCGKRLYALSPLRARAPSALKTMPWWDMSQPNAWTPQSAHCLHGADRASGEVGWQDYTE